MVHLCLLFICFWCNAPADLPVEFQWLVGSWREDTQDNRWEIWKLENETLRGKGLLISGLDTVLLEIIELKKIEDQWVYQADVPENDGPVNFVALTINEKQLIFENKLHDFPQKITYERVGADQFKAFIEGNEKERVFNFSRQLKEHQ